MSQQCLIIEVTLPLTKPNSHNLALEKDGYLEVNKKAQLSSQIITCIQASIADECALKVVASGEFYEVEIEDGAYKELILDGPLYFRNLISRVTEDLMYLTFARLTQN